MDLPWQFLTYANKVQCFVGEYNKYLKEVSEKYKNLVEMALITQGVAKTFKTQVGAVIQAINENGALKFFKGINIENITRSSDIHAEMYAMNEAIKHSCGGKRSIALALVYDMSTRPGNWYPYPACGICRQYLWENTHPLLDVLVVDKDKKEVCFAAPLEILYPLPYPNLTPERKPIFMGAQEKFEQLP